jgi:hypothetical protein
MAAAFVLLFGSINSRADFNPSSHFNSIVGRNPFGLRPPSVQAVEPASPPPVVIPPAIVALTGVTSILTSKRALLEIIPGPGKQLLKPVLSEGETLESVEVVSIDVEKTQVIIRNHGFLTNLTLKVVTPTTTNTTPPGPGLVHASGPRPLPFSSMSSIQPPVNNSPPASAIRRGVMMTSGNTSSSPTSAPAGASMSQTNPNGDPAQAYLKMKAQQEWARQRGVVLPPPPGQ